MKVISSALLLVKVMKVEERQASLSARIESALVSAAIGVVRPLSSEIESIKRDVNRLLDRGGVEWSEKSCLQL